MPYLRDKGVDRPLLIVNRADKDHAGGLEDVLAQLQAVCLVTSTLCKNFSMMMRAHSNQGVTCERDGVHVEVLQPNDNIHKPPQNNRSCVLLVKHSAGGVLITGDIGRPIERNLIEKRRNLLDTDILVVPHRRSNSSST